MKFYGFLIGLVLFPVAASAGPLDPKQVGADATWVVHLDVDAMRASTLVQRAYEKLVATNHEAVGKIETFRLQTGIDPRKDFHGLTVYGKRLGKNDGTVLVHADVDHKSLMARLRWASDYKVTAYQPDSRSYDLHTWTDAKGKKDEHQIAAAFHSPTLRGPTLIVLAPNLEQLRASLDVLDGRRPALGKDSPLAAPVPEGTGVLIRAVRLGEAELQLESPLLTQSDAFSLAVGELTGECFVQARLSTKSAETAQQVKSIAEGARAMAELQLGDKPELVSALKRFKITSSGSAVDAEFRIPVDGAWEVIDKEWTSPGAGPKRSEGPEE